MRTTTSYAQHNAYLDAISFCTLTLWSLSPPRKCVVKITRWGRLCGRLLLYAASARGKSYRYTVWFDHHVRVYDKIFSHKIVAVSLFLVSFHKFTRYFCRERTTTVVRRFGTLFRVISCTGEVPSVVHIYLSAQ